MGISTQQIRFPQTRSAFPGGPPDGSQERRLLADSMGKLESTLGALREEYKEKRTREDEDTFLRRLGQPETAEEMRSTLDKMGEEDAASPKKQSFWDRHTGYGGMSNAQKSLIMANAQRAGGFSELDKRGQEAGVAGEEDVNRRAREREAHDVRMRQQAEAAGEQRFAAGEIANKVAGFSQSKQAEMYNLGLDEALHQRRINQDQYDKLVENRPNWERRENAKARAAELAVERQEQIIAAHPGELRRLGEAHATHQKLQAQQSELIQFQIDNAPNIHWEAMATKASYRTKPTVREKYDLDYLYDKLEDDPAAKERKVIEEKIVTIYTAIDKRTEKVARQLSLEQARSIKGFRALPEDAKNDALYKLRTGRVTPQEIEDSIRDTKKNNALLDEQQAEAVRASRRARETTRMNKPFSPIR